MFLQHSYRVTRTGFFITTLAHTPKSSLEQGIDQNITQELVQLNEQEERQTPDTLEVRVHRLLAIVLVLKASAQRSRGVEKGEGGVETNQ